VRRLELLTRLCDRHTPGTLTRGFDIVSLVQLTRLFPAMKPRAPPALLYIGQSETSSSARLNTWWSCTFSVSRPLPPLEKQAKTADIEQITEQDGRSSGKIQGLRDMSSKTGQGKSSLWGSSPSNTLEYAGYVR
jgi:hypothetical protein